MQVEEFPLSWQYLTGQYLDGINPYAKEGVIPLGTVKHPSEYKEGIVPRSDIVFIDFDEVGTSTTEREAFNGLILGGSGDGKSLLIKHIWSILHDAGYFCIYIDPKDTTSGRAKKPTKIKERLAPNLKPKGLKLKHYIPSFAMRNFEHLIHNFDSYSLRLHDIYEKEMWMGLGASNIGSSKISKIIRNEGEGIRIRDLINELDELSEQREINRQSLNAMYSLLVDIEDNNLVSEKYDEISLLDDFEEGYSVCISYNSCGITWMSFDIGMKIHQCVRFYFDYNNRNPIVFFLDDSSYYAKEKKEVLKYNLAIQEIKNIGYNYRSLGICNWMAVQTLSIIEDTVAESYKYKIITPAFNNPDSLSKINIPGEVIEMLKKNKLHIDKKNYVMEYVLIDNKNNVFTFFPFMPNSNHFEEVYSSRD